MILEGRNFDLSARLRDPLSRGIEKTTYSSTVVFFCWARWWFADWLWAFYEVHKTKRPTVQPSASARIEIFIQRLATITRAIQLYKLNLPSFVRVLAVVNALFCAIYSTTI